MKAFSDEIRTSEIYKDEFKKILTEADQMVQGAYVFNNVWDMEPCDEPVANPNFKWNVRYNDDPEWAYMFTRFDFSYKLVVAYELTGDLKYIEHGLRFIDNWYRDNKVFLTGVLGKIANRLDRGKSLAHRTLDLAILVCNIADFALYCFESHIISNSDLQKLKRISSLIGQYILDDDRTFKTLTNWGPIENAYVLYASERLGLNLNNKLAFDRLCRQIETQLCDDGSHTESSPMYLVEILLGVLKYVRFGKNGNDAKLIHKIRQSCQYLKEIVTPDGCIPNIGDSDSTNISDVMIVASEIFGDNSFLRATNRHIRIEFIYKYRIKQVLINDTDRSNNAYSVLVNSVSEIKAFQYQNLIKDNTVWLLCNNIPNGPSGHKHYDFLSVLIYLKGRPFLIDSGRETYKNSEERILCKDPEAHCTVRINGDKYWKCLNAWNTEQSISDNIIRLNEVECQGEIVHSVLMSCSFGNEIIVNRIVSYINEIGILITDMIDGDKYENYQACFPLSPGVEVNDINNQKHLALGQLSVYYSNDAENPTSVIDATCSVRYNTRKKNKRILLKSQHKCITHFFLFRNADASSDISEDGDVTYLITYDYHKTIIKIKIKGYEGNGLHIY